MDGTAAGHLAPGCSVVSLRVVFGSDVSTIGGENVGELLTSAALRLEETHTLPGSKERAGGNRCVESIWSGVKGSWGTRNRTKAYTQQGHALFLRRFWSTGYFHTTTEGGGSERVGTVSKGDGGGARPAGAHGPWLVQQQRVSSSEQRSFRPVLPFSGY